MPISSCFRSCQAARCRASAFLPVVFLIAAVVISSKAFCQNSDEFSPCQNKVIRKITFSGKFKLKQSILRREIDSRAGELFNGQLLIRDQKKIDGLGIFSEVRPEIELDSDSVNIDFRLTEVWTLTPVVSLGRTDNSLDWMVGAHERDLLGYYFNVRGYYRRFEGENSYVFTGILPRTLGRDLSTGVSLALERQLDPLTVNGISAQYRYQGRAILCDLGWRVMERLYQDIFFGYRRENWTLDPAKDNPANAITEVDYPQYTLGTSISLGRIYSDHFYYDGVMLSSTFSLIRQLPRKAFDRWRIQLVGEAFQVKHGVNFCFRTQYLTSSGDERVMPYSLSGESNVRGYRDRIARGDHFLGLNVEVRRKLIETKRWYSQLAAFIDEGALWGRDRSAASALANPYWSIGGGLRGAYKLFPRIGRFDVALNTRTGKWSYYLSALQFF